MSRANKPSLLNIGAIIDDAARAAPVGSTWMHTATNQHYTVMGHAFVAGTVGRWLESEQRRGASSRAMVLYQKARARPLQGRMQQGMVSFAEAAQWYDTARAEMLRFPAGVHDDQVDALAWMATMAVGREAPRQQQAKAPKSWKDKLKTLGGTVSHMVA